MQRNLDKDDIRDASDLLTHIDGWEKTGSYDADAIEALDRWHAKRERIHAKQRLYIRKYTQLMRPMQIAMKSNTIVWHLNVQQRT